jgi:hypothetical protein
MRKLIIFASLFVGLNVITNTWPTEKCIDDYNIYIKNSQIPRTFPEDIDCDKIRTLSSKDFFKILNNLNEELFLTYVCPQNEDLDAPWRIAERNKICCINDTIVRYRWGQSRMQFFFDQSHRIWAELQRVAFQ